MRYGRRRLTLRLGCVCICSELNEISESERSQDLKVAVQEGTDAAEPELELESLMQGPKERSFRPRLDPSLKCLLYLSGQRAPSLCPDSPSKCLRSSSWRL